MFDSINDDLDIGGVVRKIHNLSISDPYSYSFAGLKNVCLKLSFVIPKEA